MPQKSDCSRFIEILFAAAAICGIFLVYFSTDNIGDSDGMYHIRHAWVYGKYGFFDSKFPWQQFSAVKTYAGDLWYGFHMALIPFARGGDLLLGMKIGGLFLSLFLFFALYYFFRKIHAHHPAFWVFLFFTASPEIFYRMTVLRPQVLSAALIALLFFFAGRADKTAKTAVFFISALVAFFHMAMAWFAVFVVFAAGVSSEIRGPKGIIRNIPAALCGSFLGLLARPDFFGSLRLFYLQTLGIFLEKISGNPLPFGEELEKADLSVLFNAWIFYALLLVAVAIFVGARDEKKSRLFRDSGNIALSSLALFAVFLFTAFFAAKRAMDFAIFFGVVFIAVIFTEIARHYPDQKGMLLKKCIILALVFAFGIFNIVSAVSYKKERGHKQDIFKDAALWLRDHSESGDIVAHFIFLDFQKLFFWNQKNYYIAGFDPIFQYAYDKRLYFYLEFSKFADPPFGMKRNGEDTRALAEELHGHLAEDFRAKYLFFEKKYFTFLKSALDKTSGFQKVFESGGEIIYQIY